MRLACVTLGCKLNYAETASYIRAFQAAGFEVVPWSRGADLFLVNTCAVTATSESKGRSVIRKLHRVSPSAPIVVTGCYAQLRREEVLGIEGVALVFGATEKSRLVTETLAYLNAKAAGVGANPANCATLGNIRGETVSEANGGVERSETLEDVAPTPDAAKDIFPAYNTGGRTRSFLKVQDGCDNFCAYCAVPYARGHSRNIPIASLVAQAKQIAEAGAKEIVLTGVNTGDFGRTTGESFLDLLKALEKVEGIERYRISSIEPNLVTDEIIDFTAGSGKFLPHFHIPLQVGTDVLLKRMGRRYDTKLFRNRIESIRAAFERPGGSEVFFGIDLMAGLPGETDELFRESYAFIESIKPAFIHIFPYSRRPGTPAATMPGQVNEEVKAERVKQLEELCEKLHSDFVERHRGLREQVLWESKEKDGLMAGYTRNYIRILRPYESSLVGRISEITI